MENCNQTHNFKANETFCNCTWDSLLYWPPTKVNTTVTQHCPQMKGMDSRRMVTNICLQNGTWLYQKSNTFSDYLKCFSEKVLMLLEHHNSNTEDELQIKIQIIKITSVLEFIGLVNSIVVLLTSIFVYYYFKPLRNTRTRIHIHLFLAMLGAVFTKFSIYIDKIIIEHSVNLQLLYYSGVHETPILCESVYIILEYFKSAMYMWMLIEGLHLYKAVTVAPMLVDFSHYYLVIGWLISAILVATWTVAMFLSSGSNCWWPYNYHPSFYILQAPRIFILLVNAILIKIMIKLIRDKMQAIGSDQSDTLRKTINAMIIILPLLGVTNVLSYIEPDISHNKWYIGFYCFFSYFLDSFQGAFVGLSTFLMHHKVKEVILKKKCASVDTSVRGTIEMEAIDETRRNIA